jgi:S-formylglutathione hydrolase FrmB
MRAITVKRYIRKKSPELPFLLVFMLCVVVIEPVNSSTVFDRFTSPALQGNKQGDPATREVRVYLPPSYDNSKDQYPVVYLLHGSGGNQHEFSFADTIADELILTGQMREMIMVGVDGTSRYSISYYANSVLNGNCGDYIARDLVNYIDSNYRTIASSSNRAIAGFSTGGYGAVYSYSGGSLGFSDPACAHYLGGDMFELAEEIIQLFGGMDSVVNQMVRVKEPDDIRAGFFAQEIYSQAAAFSPNLGNPPLFVDLPFELPGLKIIPEIRDEWYEHCLFKLLEDHAQDLASLRGFALDVGDRDDFGLKAENEAFHQALLEAGVPHTFEVFSGGHSDKLRERVAVSLEFFSDVLAFEEITPFVKSEHRLTVTWGHIKRECEGSFPMELQ